LCGLNLLSQGFLDAISSENLIENILKLKSRDGVGLNAFNDFINDLLVLDVSLNDGPSSVHREESEILLSHFVTLDHVDDSLSEHHVLDTEMLLHFTLFSEKSQIRDL